jgi:NADPH2:quinone reductase
MRVKAVRMHEAGGPEVLKVEEIELPAPAQGEVLIRQTAIGVNFIDTYHRNGLYPLPLPATPGTEAAGVVEAIGEGAEGLRVGDRVAYAAAQTGAYAEARLFPANRLVLLPEWIDDLTVAASLLKGMTAEYLLHRTFPVRKDDWIVIHAAAGATGGIMTQWAAALGAHVIATVGSEAKIAAAEAHGAEKVVLTSDADWPAKVRDFTDGDGVPVVYDGIGRDTFEGSLACLKPRGLMVSFGNASGPVPPFNLATLAQKGSLFLTRPSLFHYIAQHKELMESAASLFDAIHRGWIKTNIAQTFPLADAALAHEALASRALTGSVVLLP